MTAPTPEALLGLLAELDRIRALTVELVERRTSQLLPAPLHDDANSSAPAVYDLLVQARRAAFANPAAARQLSELLVAQGRRYAQTPAGAELRDALVGSEAVDHLRRVWEMVSLNVLDGPASPSGVPDAWVELLADAVAGRAIDAVLTRMRLEGLA
jgi:hypothetical protein